MKRRHTAAAKSAARATLEWCGINVGSDFCTLRSSHVDKLLQCADNDRYQKPKNANGSRARYYHDRLQRRAQAREE